MYDENNDMHTTFKPNPLAWFLNHYWLRRLRIDTSTQGLSGNPSSIWDTIVTGSGLEKGRRKSPTLARNDSTAVGRQIGGQRPASDPPA